MKTVPSIVFPRLSLIELKSRSSMRINTMFRQTAATKAESMKTIDIRTDVRIFTEEANANLLPTPANTMSIMRIPTLLTACAVKVAAQVPTLWMPELSLQVQTIGD